MKRQFLLLMVLTVLIPIFSFGTVYAHAAEDTRITSPYDGGYS